MHLTEMFFVFKIFKRFESTIFQLFVDESLLNHGISAKQVWCDFFTVSYIFWNTQQSHQFYVLWNFLLKSFFAINAILSIFMLAIFQGYDVNDVHKCIVDTTTAVRKPRERLHDDGWNVPKITQAYTRL